jgi:hypothetical protein
MSTKPSARQAALQNQASGTESLSKEPTANGPAAGSMASLTPATLRKIPGIGTPGLKHSRSVPGELRDRRIRSVSRTESGTHYRISSRHVQRHRHDPLRSHRQRSNYPLATCTQRRAKAESGQALCQGTLVKERTRSTYPSGLSGPTHGTANRGALTVQPGEQQKCCHKFHPQTDVEAGKTRFCNMRSKCRCSMCLQFTLLHAASCVLHRPTSQVIHRLE